MQIPEQIICPLSKKIFARPMVMADGNIYEQHEIKKWLESNDTSPLTGEKLSHEDHFKCFFMEKFVRDYLEVNPIQKINQFVYDTNQELVDDFIQGINLQNLSKLSENYYMKLFRAINLKDSKIPTVQDYDIRKTIMNFIMKNNDLVDELITVNSCKYVYKGGHKLINLICLYADNIVLIKKIIDIYLTKPKPNSFNMYENLARNQTFLSCVLLNENLPAESHIDLIKYIIIKGYDIKKHDENHSFVKFIILKTPNKLELINFFIALDVRVDITFTDFKIDPDHSSPLNRADVQTDGHFVNALFWYINESNQLLMIRILSLILKTRIDVTDTELLIKCVIGSHSLDVLKWLFLNYPDHFNINMNCEEHRTLLCFACQVGYVPIIQYLFDAGAIPHLLVENMWNVRFKVTPFRMLLGSVTDIDFIAYAYSLVKDSVNILNYAELVSEIFIIDEDFIDKLNDWFLNILVEENKLNDFDDNGYAIIHHYAENSHFDFFSKAVSLGANPLLLTANDESIFDLVPTHCDHDHHHHHHDMESVDSDDYSELSSESEEEYLSD
jgi:hypothetical protein